MKIEELELQHREKNNKLLFDLIKEKSDFISKAIEILENEIKNEEMLDKIVSMLQINTTELFSYEKKLSPSKENDFYPSIDSVGGIYPGPAPSAGTKKIPGELKSMKDSIKELHEWFNSLEIKEKESIVNYIYQDIVIEKQIDGENDKYVGPDPNIISSPRIYCGPTPVLPAKCKCQKCGKIH